jgi:hypothetical protein
MKKLKFKLKRWIYNILVKRYLLTVDASLLNLFSNDERKKLDNSFFGSDRANKERERIIKLLSSEKYKKFFFKAIRYDRNKPEGKIEPFSNKIWDKILKGISVAYLYLFNRELYERIQLFQKWTSKVSTIETQVNEYMATTTLDERADRGVMLGVIDENKGKAQKRMRNIQSLIVNKIHEKNLS